VTAEIRIYIEGSGGEKAGTISLRKAFSSFLRLPRQRAQEKGIRIIPRPCGGRENTFDDFCRAFRTNPDAFVMLLVDAEAPVRASNLWHHLQFDSGDGWKNPGAQPSQCHLMVQILEALLIADRENLAAYYGQDFQASALPATTNVEEVPKERLLESLQRATRKTRKGNYHKTHHGPAILATARPDEVARRATHCQRLFDVLAAVIEEL
jgi:hypothetical protein